jgi:hypothetical protein
MKICNNSKAVRTETGLRTEEVYLIVVLPGDP